MTRTRIRALYIAAESTYGTDPDSDGSDYVPVWTDGQISPLASGRALLDGQYSTGRNAPTSQVVGPDGGTIEFTTPLLGLSAAAGDSASPPAADWLDLLLNSCLGTGTARDGEGLGSGSGSGTLALDTSALASQDLAPVYESGLNSSRTQWRRVTGASTPYDVAPNWTATPSTAGVCYGVRRWSGPVSAGGASFAMVLVEGSTEWTLLGCRVTRLRITIPAGGKVTASWSVAFDSRAVTTKASLALVGGWTGSPLKGVLSPLMWGSTAYEVAQAELDMGVVVQPRMSTAGTNGRSEMDVIAVDPVLTISPLFATSWDTDFSAGTTRSTLLQIGAGSLSGGVLNTLGLWFEAGQIIAPATVVDDSGRQRTSVQIRCVDPGLVVAASPRVWTLARA